MDNYGRSQLNCFTHTSLDRVATRRIDTDWVAQQLYAPDTRLIPLWESVGLFSEDDTLCPLMFEPHEVRETFAAAESLVLLGELNGHTYFSLDLPGGETRLKERLSARGRFLDLHDVGAVLDAETAALLAYARGISYWHRRHRYCGECGYPTCSQQAGHMRVCTDLACGAKQFPRTDAAVITLVYHQDRCLLARQRGWPGRLFSVVAGFVEPGESIEETVVREVKEETGVLVTDVHYQSSQPWPFPSSLMLGFTARAVTTELILGDDELDEAGWYSRADIVRLVGIGELELPTAVSISYRLVEDWFDSKTHTALKSLTQR